MENGLERNVKVVRCVVGLLALLSAATGFAAEATRIKVISPSSSSGCVYPRTPAYGLGITSAAALLIAQITISAASRCTCCCSKGPHTSNPNWTLALVCFVISWFGTIVAFLVFLAGAFLNEGYDNEDDAYLGNYFCTSNMVVKPGAFAGAAVLSVASLMLGLVYYIILASEKKSVPTAQAGVAMGQPQFPPSQNAQDTVFVHEDTYVRRQFV